MTSKAPMPAAAEVNEAHLTDDAKVVLGSYCGMMIVGGTLSFGLVESRPTARGQAALDSCVKAGYLVRSEPEEGGVTYTVAADTLRFRKWIGGALKRNPDLNFKLVEKIAPAVATPSAGC